MYFHEIFIMGCCYDNTFKFLTISLCFSDASRLWGCCIRGCIRGYGVVCFCIYWIIHPFTHSFTYNFTRSLTATGSHYIKSLLTIFFINAFIVLLIYSVRVADWMADWMSDWMSDSPFIRSFVRPFVRLFVLNLLLWFFIYVMYKLSFCTSSFAKVATCTNFGPVQVATCTKHTF